MSRLIDGPLAERGAAFRDERGVGPRSVPSLRAPRPLGTTGICAKRAAGVDVNRPFRLSPILTRPSRLEPCQSDASRIWLNRREEASPKETDLRAFVMDLVSEVSENTPAPIPTVRR
jgi:hypothetical protein